MKKYFLLFIISILTGIISCGPSNKISFGFGQCLLLEKKERALSPTQDDINQFNQVLKIANSNMVFNKLLVKDLRQTFISLGVGQAVPDLLITQKADSSFTLLNAGKKYGFENEYHCFLLKKERQFIFRTIFSEPKLANTIVYDIISQDSTTISQLFTDKTYITKKVNCEL